MFNPFMLYILFKNLIMGFILFIHMSWPHVQKTRDNFLFWFGSRSCCEGPKKFYSFHLHGCITCTKQIKYFSCFLIWSSFSWICLPSWPFVSFVFLLFFLWAMKRQESCTQNVKRICLLHEYLQRSFRFSLRLVPINELSVQGVGFNEIEHSHWSRAWNWSPRPLDKGPRPRQIKLWFNLHGIILEGKPIGPLDPKKSLKGSSWFGEPKCKLGSKVIHFFVFLFFFTVFFYPCYTNFVKMEYM